MNYQIVTKFLMPLCATIFAASMAFAENCPSPTSIILKNGIWTTPNHWSGTGPATQGEVTDFIEVMIYAPTSNPSINGKFFSCAYHVNGNDQRLYLYPPKGPGAPVTITDSTNWYSTTSDHKNYVCYTNRMECHFNLK